MDGIYYNEKSLRSKLEEAGVAIFSDDFYKELNDNALSRGFFSQWHEHPHPHLVNYAPLTSFATLMRNKRSLAIRTIERLVKKNGEVFYTHVRIKREYNGMFTVDAVISNKPEFYDWDYFSEKTFDTFNKALKGFNTEKWKIATNFGKGYK